jgi:hypothetical protein
MPHLQKGLIGEDNIWYMVRGQIGSAPLCALLSPAYYSPVILLLSGMQSEVMQQRCTSPVNHLVQ